MWGKSQHILKLYNEGDKTIADIAREVGCTPANVSQTIKRHYNDWGYSYLPLTQKQINWLSKRAKKKGITMKEVAAQILRSAINREIANGDD